LKFRALIIVFFGGLAFAVIFGVLHFAVGLSMAETFTGMFALSGWAAIMYSHISEKSSIRANLLSVIPGIINFPDHRSMSSFIAYIYLVNPGKSPIHLLDCELDVKIKGGGWEPLKRVYGKSSPVPVTFEDGTMISVPDDEVIYHKSKLMQLGVPIYGWAKFQGDVDLLKKDFVAYRLVCIDAYGRRYELTRKVDSLVNGLLAYELAGARPQASDDGAGTAVN